jgi:hypothetical protein
MRKLGIPPENLQPGRYAGPRFNLVPCVEAKRRPLVLDRDYSLLTQWRVDFNPTTGSEGEIWHLIKFDTNGDAIWQRIEGTTGSSPLLTVTPDAATAPGVSPVEPDGGGDIDFLGAVVAAHNMPIETHTRALNTVNIEVQVGKARTGAPGNKTEAGMVCFDDTAFAVDADGYVTFVAGAGPAFTDINVTNFTGPGTDPVVPVAGVLVFRGAAVAQQGLPVDIHSRAAGALNVEIQAAATNTGAPGNKNKLGLAQFDDTAFSVDADGYVTLTGAGLSLSALTVDAVTGPGVNPVVPTAGGGMTASGMAVAAHSVPVEIRSRAANAYNVEAQVATTVNAAPGNKDDVGMAVFSDDDFTVNTDGFVQLKNPGGPTSGASNLGIKYSGGTFSICAKDGTDLSATNPGYVTLPLVASPGLMKTITLTDNRQFIDSTGVSTVAGMYWGTTSSVGWNKDMPFYIYAIMKDSDDDVAIAIGRSPANEVSYASANIGVSGATVTTNHNSFFLLDVKTGPTTPTVGDYDENPSVLIGSFRMRKVASAANDWTVQALDDTDGIDRFNFGTLWDMPTGVNGATTGTFFQTTTGTQPIFTSQRVNYTMERNGNSAIQHEHNGISTYGAGAGLLRPTNPFSTIQSGDGWMAYRIGFSTDYIANATLNGSDRYFTNIKESGSATAWTNATFASGVGTSASFALRGTVKAFN